MSGFGPSADWFRNLQAAPAVEVAIGRRRFRPQHRIVDETDAAGVLAGYERRNRLIAPIVRLGLGWLAGWPYDGIDAALPDLCDNCRWSRSHHARSKRSRAGADLRGWDRRVDPGSAAPSPEPSCRLRSRDSTNRTRRHASCPHHRPRMDSTLPHRRRPDHRNRLDDGPRPDSRANTEATTRLVTGQRVTMDGASGVMQITNTTRTAD
jgi:hypothetical protein